MSRHEITVCGSSANLGPGFDVLGLSVALTLHLEVETASANSWSFAGEGTIKSDERNLVFEAFNAGFEALSLDPPPVAFRCHNAIPIGRGLGSSAAAIVGGLLAARCLGAELTDQKMLELASDLEGHPDNVAASLLGGLTLVAREGAGLHARSIPFPREIAVVLLVPDQPSPTVQARAVLASRIATEDAVFNLGRLAMLLAALATGNYQDLRLGMQDRLHQPARAALYPWLEEVMEAAIRSGSYGASLSGAGPSVLALTPTSTAYQVGEAMRQAAEVAGASAHEINTRPGTRPRVRRLD